MAGGFKGLSPNRSRHSSGQSLSCLGQALLTDIPGSTGGDFRANAGIEKQLARFHVVSWLRHGVLRRDVEIAQSPLQG